MTYIVESSRREMVEMQENYHFHKTQYQYKQSLQFEILKCTMLLYKESPNQFGKLIRAQPLTVSLFKPLIVSLFKFC